jgi:hypothetical protein
MVGASVGGAVSAGAAGNSANANACQKGGWQDWVREDGTAFTNQGECVSYAAQGGTLAEPAPAVLVRAYTNLDGVAGFGSGDVEIARLTDDNRDGIVSAGDVVTLGQYPRDFAGTVFGTFGVTTHVVNSVVGVPTAVEVVVGTDSGAQFGFTSRSNGPGSGGGLRVGPRLASQLVSRSGPPRRGAVLARRRSPTPPGISAHAETALVEPSRVALG